MFAVISPLHVPSAENLRNKTKALCKIKCLLPFSIQTNLIYKTFLDYKDLFLTWAS